jgi:hypothetical protein
MTLLIHLIDGAESLQCAGERMNSECSSFICTVSMSMAIGCLPDVAIQMTSVCDNALKQLIKQAILDGGLTKETQEDLP